MNILSMSGFVPEQICDTIRFSKYSGERNISHYCGYASDFISRVLQDDGIDGAVFPKSCDSTRIISGYLTGSNKFLFQISVPSYGAPGAEEYFAGSIKAYKEAVENYYGVRLDDVAERTEMVNLRNKIIAGMYENISEISFSDYLESIHKMLGLPLSMQQSVGHIKAHTPTNKRVFVVGSFLSNTEIAGMMEAAGLTVVGDTLTESGRLASAQSVKLSGDIYRNIADSILSQRLSPTQNYFHGILEKDIEEIKRKSVKGVVFITQKYCEAYDYLYSVYKSAVDALGIPVIQVAVNDTEDSRKAALVLEAFADTL